jgi:hypothetical protein
MVFVNGHTWTPCGPHNFGLLHVLDFKEKRRFFMGVTRERWQRKGGLRRREEERKERRDEH